VIYRFTVQCAACGTYVAHVENLMDGQEIKKRHDTLQGHEARIEAYQGAS